eukprot:313511-Rhodomonas_salina.1
MLTRRAGARAGGDLGGHRDAEAQGGSAESLTAAAPRQPVPTPPSSRTPTHVAQPSPFRVQHLPPRRLSASGLPPNQAAASGSSSERPVTVSGSRAQLPVPVDRLRSARGVSLEPPSTGTHWQAQARSAVAGQASSMPRTGSGGRKLGRSLSLSHDSEPLAPLTGSELESRMPGPEARGGGGTPWLPVP